MCFTEELHVVDYSTTVYIQKTVVNSEQSQCQKPHREKMTTSQTHRSPAAAHRTHVALGFCQHTCTLTRMAGTL